MEQKHNPFRVRTAYDKLCVWLEDKGKPMRLYCTRTFRTKDGLLGLERITNGGRIATAKDHAYLNQILIIEKI